MLITMYDNLDFDSIWNRIGFYCKEAKLINRTLAVDCLLTIPEAEALLEDFNVKIRKLPLSYKFSPDQ
jgi:hypothetical protein